ncbi:hypothetical protein BJY04DRAFT_223221 [Aspergillus karnatakaensis]|uniref:uncharacterized protein n=1 Tax=Aspergillus karnatakaensis TaxID=1810916 RepID=UPI003CCE00B6
MIIITSLRLAGLMLPLLLQSAQTKNTQAILATNIIKDKYIIEQSLPSASGSSNKGYNATLNFDDVPTDAESGTGPLSLYSYLDFTSFVAVDTHAAAPLGSISIHDTDCASSQPNALFNVHALLGDNQLHLQPRPRPRWISNPTRLHAAGLSTYFNLKGLSFKPLGRVPRGLVLEIIAWEVADSVAVNVYNTWVPYLQGGYQSMEWYDLTIFGTGWGERVNMVEVVVWTEDGAEAREWGFCLDDLEIEFLERELGD